MSEVDSIPSAISAYELPNTPARILSIASEALTAAPKSGTVESCGGLDGSFDIGLDGIWIVLHHDSLLQRSDCSGNQNGYVSTAKAQVIGT